MEADARARTAHGNVPHQFFEDVRAAIFSPKGELLLVRHAYADRLWSLPGGSRDHPETFPAAILREVQEETNIAWRIGALIGLYVGVKGKRSVALFLGDTDADVAPYPNDPNEIAEARIFAENEIPWGEMFPAQTHLVRHALEQQHHIFKTVRLDTLGYREYER